MNIFFVCHSGVVSHSGVHVVNLASILRELGATVAIAVPDGVVDEGSTSDRRNLPVFPFTVAPQALFDGAKADLVHAWTPRQNVSKATRRLSASHGCPYVVHLEDHEHVVTAGMLNLSVEALHRQVRRNPAVRIPQMLSHPSDMLAFLDGAAGITAIVDRLLEFKPVSRPGLVIWPAAEDDLFRPQPRDVGLMARLGIEAGRKIVVYNGAVHPINAKDMAALYAAIYELAGRGVPITLVRLGKDWVPFRPAVPAGMEKVIVHVPFQERAMVPMFLALADVLVQPGTRDLFDAYRFPSKLPEFFAMGRPVILPATNIGLEVKDGEEGLLLEGADSTDIAAKIQKILSDDALAARLATGARRFYENRFGWKRSGAKLMNFYSQLLRPGE